LKPLTKQTLQRFLALATDRLEGQWVLVGGSLIPLLGGTDRITYDIDLVGPRDATQSHTLLLMEIADELGLSIESLNQAAAYFLYRIPGFEKDLLPLCQGERGSVMRPTAALYVELKLARFTESDLADCLFYVDYARRHAEPLDKARMRHAAARQEGKSSEIGKRTRKLLQILEGC